MVFGCVLVFLLCIGLLYVFFLVFVFLFVVSGRFG